MAREANDHPILHIRGKTGDEAKWARWEKVFHKQDMTKPFLRPEGK